jgi:hypothetical protein
MRSQVASFRLNLVLIFFAMALSVAPTAAAREKLLREPNPNHPRPWGHGTVTLTDFFTVPMYLSVATTVTR